MSDHPSRSEPNRLAGESSPYLLLHQHNPVDWYPWGPEALQRARDEDKPIFLSVGYSTCYWCHVMERESFSDQAIAELMNESFVNIKIDREERPDLDEIYMVATQVMAGQGGWPNSVFLTPDLGPYFAGTYFPPTDAHGRPGFPTVLRSMRDAWHERRSDVLEQAESIVGAIRHYLEERSAPAEELPGREVTEGALLDLQRRFDQTWGGFGGAPKFPTPSNLLLLTELAGDNPRAAEMLAATLDQMARGGIYDQLGGGFHRYATDREWKIPHFEKMLYDNAWLLEVYARYAHRESDAEAARIVRETAGFIERELTGPEGGFWSALDAETDGHEGAFYVWTRDELNSALGEEDATFLAPLYGFDTAPFFEGSHYVLHLPARLADQGARRQLSREELLEQMESSRRRLLAERSQRPALLTDDKVLADWNGMTISGLAIAGRLLEEEAFIERAARAARFVLETLRSADGVLLHAWRAGSGAKVPALLGDYVCMVRGLLALYDATEEPEWLEAAVDLSQEQVERLGDPDEGGFFVAAESDDVLVRSKEIFDGATPSGNSLAVLNLLRLAELTGEARWRELAGDSLRAFGSVVRERPNATPMLAIAARRHAAQGADAAAEPKIVLARIEAAPEAGEEGEVRLRLEIAPGWHIYAADPGDDALPGTTLTASGIEQLDVEWPEGEPWQPSDALPPARIYEGTLTLVAQAGGVAEDATLTLTFQPCDDNNCLAPQTLTLAL